MTQAERLSEKLYAATRDGLDIILDYYPEAEETLTADGGKKKKIKMRDERTPSATLRKSPTKGVWTVTDFGDDGHEITPIQLASREEGISWKEALYRLCGKYGVRDALDKDINKPLRGWINLSDGTRSENFSSLDISESDIHLDDYTDGYVYCHTRPMDAEELEVMGPLVRAEHAAALQWQAVAWKVHVSNGRAQFVVSTPTYPIFRRECVVDKECRFFKLYEPFNYDKGFRFQYYPRGGKPARYVNGLAELRRAYTSYNEQEARVWESDPANENHPYHYQKLESAFLCSGERDSLCVRSLGGHPLWLNSETDELTPAEYQEVMKMVEVLYNIPDIDETGLRRGKAVALKFLDALGGICGLSFCPHLNIYIFASEKNVNPMAIAISSPTSARNGAYTFTSEADVIVISGTTASEQYTVSVAVGSTTLLNTALYSDRSGRIILTDIRRLLESSGLSGVFTVTITVGSTTLTFPAVRCSVLLPFAAEKYLQFAGPSLSPTSVPVAGHWSVPDDFGRAPVRRTALGWTEFIGFLCSSENTVITSIVFYRQGTEVRRVVTDLTAEIKSTHHISFTVGSLYRFSIETSRFWIHTYGLPLAYCIQITDPEAGSVREASFVVEPHPEGEIRLQFRDSFGYHRYLYCQGVRTDDPSYDRQTAVISGQLTTYNITETQSRTVHTGPLTPEEAVWVRDLLRSTEVYEFRPDGTGLRVVITASESACNTLADAITDYTITYRYSPATPVMDKYTDSHTFDGTFTQPFN